MPIKNNRKASLSDFLALFPILDPPITLTDKSHHYFDKHGKVIPKVILEEYFQKYDDDDKDEYTEYMPCLQVPIQEGDFTALVFWKAGLLKYQYFLLTLDKKGEIIDKKSIAGTFVKDGRLLMRVANIDEELNIYIAESNPASPEQSISYNLELLPSGKIRKL